MSKTERLKKLFEEWRVKQSKETEESLKKTKIKSENITKEHFCEDGIISEELYNEQNLKVLFIAKEPNIANEKTEKVSTQINSFINYYNSGIDDWRGKLRRNTSKYYSWIIPDEQKNEELHKLASQFAFMNLNKRGGGSAADNRMIAEYCKVYKEFISKEIGIINPDIIVWLGFGTFDEIVYSKEKIFDFIIKYDNGKDEYFIKVDGKEIPVIRVYHPSYYRVSDDRKREVIQNSLH